MVTTGEDAKIEAGNYMIRVKAYRDGVCTGVYKDVMVVVNELFTDFGLNEVDGTGKIILKENDYHKNLTISGAATVNSLDDVKIKSVNLLNGNNVMRISSKNRLTGNNSGVGNAEISVTAEYESPKGNVYTLTKNFPVKVTSVFESMTINGGDLFHIFEVYGLGQGEISEVSINKNSTRSFRIMKNLQSAGVDYEVVSDNEAVEVELNQLTGNFTIRGKNVGEANIIVTVTPKNAENNEGAVTNSFKVVVNPILENITASDLEIDQGDFGQIVATANDGLTPTYFYIETTRGGNILSIDSDGSFSAIAGKHGVATVNIIAIDPNARIVSKTINVKVNAVLNLITLKENEITVYEGDTAEIEIDSVVDGSIRDQVTWSYTGYDHSIIGMGGTNKITPRRDGVTTVTVTGTFVSPLGKIYTAKATVNVVVKSKLESITVEDINVKVGERADINITVDANDITPRYTYEYSDNTIARNSRSGGVRALKAGDTELTVTARHFGKTVTATAMVHVYEMEAPEHHHYYGATGEVFEVHVGDKNTNAYTVARVDKMGMMVMGDRAVAFMPGVYTVTYTDYMANGEKVGEYTAKFTVFRVERETVVVARGETKYLDGHSEWGTTSAKDETTGHHVHVNRNGKVVFATDQETALGVHEVTMKHSFGRDAREIVKRVTVVVYEVTADSETDPEGITADTLKDYIEGMFTQPTSWEEMIAKMQQAQDLFGTGFESVWSAMGVSGAVMNGSEIATRVEVTELEEVDVDENLISAVEALNVDNVEYYDVSVWMSRDGYDFGRLHQLNNKITVALTTVTDPESGYARKYIVVRQHEGEEPEVLVEGVDFYIEDGVLYVISDKFSTFAVAYQDTMIPAYGSVTYTVKAPETGESTIEGSSANDNSMIMAIVTMIAAITIAGVAVFTKRK